MSATILPFPGTQVRLLHLDGTSFARTMFFAGTGPHDAWNWVVETVARELECDESLIHCNDDDCITVDGIPVYLCDVC